MNIFFLKIALHLKNHNKMFGNVLKVDFSKLNIPNTMKSYYTGKYIESTVYDTKLKQNKSLPTLRKSKTLTIKIDANITTMICAILEHIETTTRKYIYNNVHVDIIKYEEGDFFGKHNDFTILNTNLMDGYSLIICLEGNCKGGRTIIYDDDDVPHYFDESITTGSGLLFMNQLYHEGEIITHGTKMILKIDLYGLRIIEVKENPIFIIYFDDSDKFYVIPQKVIEEFPDCKLQLYKIFNNLDQNIILYKEDEIKPDDFNHIYNLFNTNGEKNITEDTLHNFNYIGLDTMNEKYMNNMFTLISNEIYNKSQLSQTFKSFLTGKLAYIITNTNEYKTISELNKVIFNNMNICPFQCITMKSNNVDLDGRDDILWFGIGFDSVFATNYIKDINLHLHTDFVEIFAEGELDGYSDDELDHYCTCPSVYICYKSCDCECKRCVCICEKCSNKIKKNTNPTMSEYLNFISECDCNDMEINQVYIGNTTHDNDDIISLCAKLMCRLNSLIYKYGEDCTFVENCKKTHVLPYIINKDIDDAIIQSISNDVTHSDIYNIAVNAYECNNINYQTVEMTCKLGFMRIYK